MKKIAAVLILILVFSVTATAKTGVGGTSAGQWSAGARLGYSFGLSGFGGWSNSAYGKHDWGYKPSAAFEIFGQYQLKKKIAIGGEIYWQGAKWDRPAGFSGSAGSWTSILFLATYEPNPGKTASMILLGGAGFYESDFGINGGVAYRSFVSRELALMGGARVHWVFNGVTFAWLQLFFGIQFFFGK